jgi:hypothetical protein
MNKFIAKRKKHKATHLSKTSIATTCSYYLVGLRLIFGWYEGSIYQCWADIIFWRYPSDKDIFLS